MKTQTINPNQPPTDFSAMTSLMADHPKNTAPLRSISQILESYTTISLDEMDAVRLMDRIDQKYLITVPYLLNILTSLRADYRILTVNNTQLNDYRTLYFDTPNFDLYTLHINGKKSRFKIRSREYLSSHSSFFEVKQKTNKGRTIKNRIATAKPLSQVTETTRSWLKQYVPLQNLQYEPKLWNQFYRITLVGVNAPERVTIDMDITVSDGQRSQSFGDLVIAEVKFDKENSGSPFLLKMHQDHVKPQNFSKYVLGVNLLYDQVKKNSMKYLTLKMDKLQREEASHE